METTGPLQAGAPAGAGGFETTHWSMVFEAARQDSPRGQAALASLYRAYWKPIYSFVRRSGYAPEEAEDLTQDFFADIIERNWLDSVTREGGRFRSLLLTVLKHRLSHARQRDRAMKRGGGVPLLSLDRESAGGKAIPEPLDTVTPETAFEQRWALSVLENAMDRLRLEYVRMEKAELFDTLKVFLSGGTRPIPHAEVAVQHDVSVSAVGVAIHRLRRRFGEILREQIAQTVTSPQDIDAELRHLVTALGPGS